MQVAKSPAARRSVTFTLRQGCQSALNFDPRSASKIDPIFGAGCSG
jgi:hypothetical protein